MKRTLPFLLVASLALFALAAPTAAAKEIRVYDCGTYGPGMECLDERDLLVIESDLLPTDVEVCGEIFYPSGTC